MRTNRCVVPISTNYVNAQLQQFLSNVFVCEYMCVGSVDMGVVDVCVCVCVCVCEGVCVCVCVCERKK
jgi:hypothetical protein